MSKIEASACNRAIAKLDRQIDEKKSSLKEMQDFHAAAWREYGSELCAGDMSGKEASLRKDISETRRLKSLLLEVRDGNIDPFDDAPFLQLLDEAERAMAAASASKQEAKDALATNAALRRLLGS